MLPTPSNLSTQTHNEDYSRMRQRECIPLLELQKASQSATDSGRPQQQKLTFS